LQEIDPKASDAQLSSQLDITRSEHTLKNGKKCTLAIAVLCGQIKGWKDIPPAQHKATVDGLERKVANILEKGETPETAQLHKDHSYKTQVTNGGVNINADLHPFNAPSTGALVVTSAISQDGNFFANNKFAPQENAKLVAHGLAESKKVIDKEEPATNIPSKMIASVQKNIDTNHLKQRKKAVLAEKGGSKGSGTNNPFSVDDATSALGGLSLNRDKADRLANAVAKWDPKSQNLHGEHGTLNGIETITQNEHGVPGDS